MIASGEGLPLVHSDGIPFDLASRLSRFISLVHGSLQIGCDDGLFEIEFEETDCLSKSIFIDAKLCFLLLLPLPEDKETANFAALVMENWIKVPLKSAILFILTKISEYSFKNIETVTFSNSVGDSNSSCDSEEFWEPIVGDFSETVLDALKVLKVICFLKLYFISSFCTYAFILIDFLGHKPQALG